MAVAAPWFGGASLLLLFAVRLHLSPGVQLVFVGFGGILGYIASSWAFYFLIECADFEVVQTFLGLVSLSLLATAFCAFNRFRSVRDKLSLVAGSEITNGIWPLLALIALLYLSVSVFAVLSLPAQGWDVLDHWGKWGGRFLDHAQETAQGAFHYESRHPLTVSLILAWSSLSVWGGAVDENIWSVWSFPWLMMSVSAAAVTAGWVYWFSKNTTYAFVASLLLWTIPLVEAQVLISGYADLLLAVVVLGVIAILSVAISEEDTRLATVGISFLTLAVALKNIGIAHAAIVVFAFIICWEGRYHRAIKITAVVFGLAFLMSAITGTFRFESDLFPTIAYIPEKDRIIFAGYSMKIVPPSLTDLMSLELHSKILNMTFSVGLIIFLLCMLFRLYLPEIEEVPRSRALTMVLCFVLLELVLLFFSNFLDRGLRYALPGVDTGYSRFSLPVFTSVPLLLGGLMSLARHSSFKKLSNIRDLHHQNFHR